jgi:hypothetical protein
MSWDCGRNSEKHSPAGVTAVRFKTNFGFISKWTLPKAAGIERVDIHFSLLPDFLEGV